MYLGEIHGVGTIGIFIPSGEVKYIPNVLYVPGLTKSFIYVTQVNNVNYTFISAPHKCILKASTPTRKQLPNVKGKVTFIVLEYLFLQLKRSIFPLNIFNSIILS